MIIDVIFIRRPRYLANESLQDTNVKRGHLETHGWPSTQPGSLHTAQQRKYTQPCSLFSRGTAVWTMGAQLCEQWGTAVCKYAAV